MTEPKKLECSSMKDLPLLARLTYIESPFLFAQLLLEAQQRYGEDAALELLDRTRQAFRPGEKRGNFLAVPTDAQIQA